MSDVVEDAERAALRGVAHLLPRSAAADRRAGRRAGPPDASRDGAGAHRRGRGAPERDRSHRRADAGEPLVRPHARLPVAARRAGRARAHATSTGSAAPSVNVNPYDGSDLRRSTTSTRTQFDGEAEDPDHSGRLGRSSSCQRRRRVRGQLRPDLARSARPSSSVADPDPGLVMGYYDAARSAGLRPPRRASTAWSIAGSARCRAPPGPTASTPHRPGGRHPRRHLAADLLAARASSDTSTSTGSTGAGTRSIRARCARSTRPTGWPATTASPSSTRASCRPAERAVGELTEEGRRSSTTSPPADCPRSPGSIRVSRISGCSARTPTTTTRRPTCSPARTWSSRSTTRSAPPDLAEDAARDHLRRARRLLRPRRAAGRR